MTKKSSPSNVQQARERLKNAIGDHASAQGRAEWINGYRVGNPAREQEFHAQEMRQWERASVALAVLDKAILTFAGAIRREERKR